MSPIIRNILAVVAGWLIGGAINMLLIRLGYVVMPIEGLDPSDMEALAEIMPSLEPKYFLFPFLAHAVGTFIGAFIAAKLGVSNKLTLAMIVGAIFLAGGIAMAMMIPAPTWFVVADLLLAYIPMAWLGGRLGK